MWETTADKKIVIEGARGTYEYTVANPEAIAAALKDVATKEGVRHFKVYNGGRELAPGDITMDITRYSVRAYNKAADTGYVWDAAL